MKKFFFYGASVTKQTGESGYIPKLKQLLDGYAFIDSKGFGACHLDDAGFYMTNEVINASPDVCILEWNTTGLNEFNSHKLRSILLEISSRNIPIGLLILPRIGNDTNITKNRPAEMQIHEISEKYGVPLLDLRFNLDLKNCLRDDVHTNDYGADSYAQSIASWIRNTNFNLSIFPQDWITLPKISINEGYEISKNKKIEIDFKIENYPISEICFELTVGPSIVDIEVVTHDQKIHKSFLDPWCYYERNMIYSIWSNSKSYGSNNITIIASEIEPNLSILKNDFVRDFENLKINVHNIFACGINLNQVRSLNV
jgi:hypothetical protein